jgi:16S rRNA (guanine(966)-N(2))-methyltransferase RsmD
MSLRIYGNRLLKTLPGEQTRPTAARVREAVFNVWQGNIAGCRWLDLCAGAGTMSAEALCRGALEVVAMEQSPRALAIIRENLQRVKQADQTVDILRGDVMARLKSLQGRQFDRMYFDPPYASSLYQPVLAAIADYQLLAPDGEIAVEHRSDRLTLDPIPTLEILRERRYSNTTITFIGLSDESAN